MPWRPDAAVLGAQVLANARNGIKTATSWQPQKAGAALGTQLITGPIQGITTATRLDGTLELFVAAAGYVYRVPSRIGALQAIKDDYYSGAPFAAGPDIRWRWLQFGDLLLGTNFADPIQAYDLTAGGSMLPLSVEAPKARYIALVRDFPVVAHTFDELDGVDAYRVQWPGFVDGVVDPTEWSLGDLRTQADFQPMSDIGQITGLTGGQFGTIVGESGVAVMQYGAQLFSFTTVERKIGCRIPNSVVQYRQQTYFWAPQGVMAFDGNAVNPIGFGKIDDWLRADFDEGDFDLVWSAPDPTTGCVLWLYAGKGHVGRPNRLLRFDPTIGEFSLSDFEADALGPGRTFAGDLDDLDQFPDLDAGDINLDDPGLWISLPQTVLVQGGYLAGFGGPAMEGTFEPAPFQITDAGRALLTKALTVHDGGTATITVGAREQFGASVTWSNPHPKQADGFHRFREPGRTHFVRSIMTGDWQNLQAVDLYATPVGKS
jgi:hypothetical protein